MIAWNHGANVPVATPRESASGHEFKERDALRTSDGPQRSESEDREEHREHSLRYDDASAGDEGNADSARNIRMLLPEPMYFCSNNLSGCRGVSLCGEELVKDGDHSVIICAEQRDERGRARGRLVHHRRGGRVPLAESAARRWRWWV